MAHIAETQRVQPRAGVVDGTVTVTDANGNLVFEVEIDGREDEENFTFLLTAVNVASFPARGRNIEVLKAARDLIFEMKLDADPRAVEVLTFLGEFEEWCEHPVAPFSPSARPEVTAPALTIHHADGDEHIEPAAFGGA